MAALNKIASPATAVVYGLLSLSMAFLNKSLINQYEFGFPLFILTCQMLLTVVVLESVRALWKFDLPNITFAAIKNFASPAVCYALHAALSLYALQGMNIPMYGALKRCTPLVNLILSVTYLKKPAPSQAVMTSVGMITLGCLVASLHDPTFDGFAYTMGGLSVVLQGLYQTLVQQCGEDKMSPVHALHLNSCITVTPFMVLTFIKGEFYKIHQYQHLTDQGFLCMFVMVVSLGLMLNFSLFLCTMLNSALTTSIVGVAKSVLQTFIGFFTFGGVKADLVNISGIILNTAGGIMYTYAKYQEQVRKATKLTHMDKEVQKSGNDFKYKDSPPA